MSATLRYARRCESRCAGIVALLILGACASGPGAGEGPSGVGAACLPMEAMLAAGASLEDRAGRYGLELVADEDRRTATGILELLPAPPEYRDLAGATTPLYGFTDADPVAVGAQPVRGLDSRDLASPGVLVLESDRQAGRSVLLRLGSDANRRDRVAYDGAYVVLDVHSIDGDGFSGSWRSGSGVERAGGWFCAVRAGS